MQNQMYSVHASIHKITSKYWGLIIIIWGFVGNSAHLKTKGSENLCLVRSSQKTNQNQKKERIFTCSKLLLCLWLKENFQQVCDLCFFYTYGVALAAVGIAFNKAPEESNSLRWKFISYFQVYGINDILCIVVVAYLFWWNHLFTWK